MTAAVYANSFVQEGNVDGTITVTFPWKSRKIIVTNDSGIDNLGVTILIGYRIGGVLKYGLFGLLPQGSE